MASSQLRALFAFLHFVATCSSLLTVELRAAEWKLCVQLSEAVATEPFSGRVYVFFSKKENVEPRLVFRFLNS